jgi:hypothetical protein
MSAVPTIDGSGSIPLTLMLLLSLTQAIGLVMASAPPRIDPALRRLVNAGSARVIVELRLDPPFAPEGTLPDASAIAAQQQAIGTAQDQVLSGLRGTRFSLVQRYTTTPFLALTIGRDALDVLEHMGDLVTRVIEDTEAAPTTPPGPMSPTR